MIIPIESGDYEAENSFYFGDTTAPQDVVAVAVSISAAYSDLIAKINRQAPAIVAPEVEEPTATELSISDAHGDSNTNNTAGTTDEKPDQVDLLVAVIKGAGLLIDNEKPLDGISNKTGLQMSLKNLLKQLKKDTPLTEEEKRLFQENEQRLTINSFKKHLKDILGLKALKVTSPQTKTETIDVIKKGIALLVACKFNLEQRQTNINDTFLDGVKKKLEAMQAASSQAEIIIIDDKGLQDDEILHGLIMRDQAHKKHHHSALIMTRSELSLLVKSEGLAKFALSPIYKISTLRHISAEKDFEVLANDILALTDACSKQNECQLKEIVLRQCLSAGKRDKKDVLSSTASSALAVSESASGPHDDTTTPADSHTATPTEQTEPDIISEEEKEEEESKKIFDHSKKLTTAEWMDLKQKHRLLKTEKAEYQEEEEEEEDAIADNITDIKQLKKLLSTQRDTIGLKIPGLLIKGYYGYVTPSALSDVTNKYIMRPIVHTSKSQEPQALPEILYKAVRIPVFSEAEHTKRIKPTAPGAT